MDLAIKTVKIAQIDILPETWERYQKYYPNRDIVVCSFDPNNNPNKSDQKETGDNQEQDQDEKNNEVSRTPVTPSPPSNTVTASPERGTLRLWRLKDSENNNVGYVYGCFHGNYLMSYHQYSFLRSSDQLLLEHDYFSLNSWEKEHLRRLYPDLSDELVLSREFHRCKKLIIPLDRFDEFTEERAIYQQCVDQHSSKLTSEHSEMCVKINNGQYDFDQMRLTDEKVLPEMRQFLSIREEKWTHLIVQALTKGSVSLVVGLGHIYPLYCRLRQYGYRLFELELHYA